MSNYLLLFDHYEGKDKGDKSMFEYGEEDTLSEEYLKKSQKKKASEEDSPDEETDPLAERYVEMRNHQSHAGEVSATEVDDGER